MAKNIIAKNRIGELLYNWKVAPYVFVLPFLLWYNVLCHKQVSSYKNSSAR